VPGIASGIGRFAGDMFGAIAHASPKGRAIARRTKDSVEALTAYGVPDSAIAAYASGRKELISHGKKIFGYAGIGASGISMAASNRSTGAYQPAPKPLMSAPPGLGRSA
jgi:hypothetical protein